MITSVLKKIESGWIRLDWAEYIHRLKLSGDDLETIVDLVDNFKRNRKAKDIVITKYRFLPGYVCVVKPEFGKLLDWIYEECIKREKYETCGRILEVKKGL
jgi:hypothetical protein